MVAKIEKHAQTSAELERVEPKRKNRKWCFESVVEAASKCSNVTEMSKRFRGAHAFARENNMVKDLFSIRKWDEESVRYAASKCSSLGEFHANHRGAAAYASKHGINNLIKSKFERWTKEKVHNLALMYDSRSEFYENHSSAKDAAKRLGVLELICSHMKVKRVRWTIKTLKAEAIKYDSRADFKRGSNGAYIYSRRRGLLNDICHHMGGRKKSDLNVIYMWEAVGFKHNKKQVYKVGVTSKRLGDERVYICASRSGCDVDGLVMAECESATNVESELLKIGDNPKYIGHDGASEFRAMSDTEYSNAYKVIYENAKSHIR
ncbi:hypothetical protein NVP1210O_63 [Vibrio phage 1.210.O._10N.222.52.C2]|nr:hypothetical protein NVP1210O_63 [Vibrio phage 1.210.O._10N.222.52.C2]